MNRHNIIALMLASGLLSGCISIKITTESKPKHHHGEEAEDREERKEDEDSKGEDRKESGEEKEDHEKGSKKEKEHGEEAEEREEKEGGEGAKAKLMARAKVSESKARAIALAKVPGGTIKEGGLEEENGKLIWSFDIATEGSKDITEVAVDAIRGGIVSVSKETPSDQAKEKEADEKEARKKAEKD